MSKKLENIRKDVLDK